MREKGVKLDQLKELIKTLVAYELEKKILKSQYSKAPNTLLR